MYNMGGGGTNPTATTDADGVARFEGIPAGSLYELRTVDMKYLQPSLAPFDVGVGGVTRKEIEVRESATLVVTLVPASGSASLAMSRLDVKGVSNGESKTQWVRGKRPKTGVYPPGRYEGRAQRVIRPGSGLVGPARWSVLHTIELVAGKPTKLEIIVP